MKQTPIAELAAAHLTSGRVDAAAVAWISETTGASLEEIMASLVGQASRYSRANISGFLVGAVAESETGNLYLGGNIELPAGPLHLTIHAEQAAVIHAGHAGETAIRRLALTTVPCGHCRQFLHELAGAEAIRLLIEGKPPALLGELLPQAFGPQDLHVQQRLLQCESHPLRWQTDAPVDELAEAVLRAANRSYAPYSRSPAGVAIRTVSDSVFGGSYWENAAFNPTISPLQSAITELVIAGEDPENICEVVLVQRADSQIDHASECQFQLCLTAPESDFRCWPALT